MLIKHLILLLLVVTCEGSDKPHIVFILADDIGWNDFSFHGSDQIPTPNIDALAYNGVILHQHYVQPICTPTRSALMTGRYPSNIGMQGSPLGAAEPRALPQGKILPQYLKDLGYSTHMVGKWHLEASDLSGKYATDVFTEEAERIIQQHDNSTPLFLYLAHLAAHAGNRGKLLEAPQEIIDKFPYIVEPNRKTYAATIRKLDESVGRVVKALQETGKLENSIIVFMSDNGSPTNGPYYQNWGSNHPFRGVKSTQWEGGVRTPAVVWSPLFTRRVSQELMHVTDWLPTLYSAAGGEDALSENLDGVDQWQSLLHIRASQRSNALLEFDEKNMIFALRDENWKITQGSSSNGDDYYGDSGKTSNNPPYNVSAVLNSDAGIALSQISRHKVQSQEILQIREEVTVTCPEQENATPCIPKTDTVCLFNLTADPCETNNLANAYPEQVQHMLQLLDGFWTTLVKQINQPTDLNADPKQFNNVWTPWIS
ncbi:Arylsulfatase B [Blattella germanica]|nr:Arylsulfatase B [Blattella germanica]